MEFLFPLIVVALGGTMFYFRWRARQRRLYGSANSDIGATSGVVGLSTVMGTEHGKAADLSSTSLAGPAAGRQGDSYSSADSDGGSSSSSGSDGGGGDGGGGGGD